MPLPLAIAGLWATLKVSKLFWGALALVAVLGLLWGSLAAYGGARYKAGLTAGAERERAASKKLAKAETKGETRITAKADKAETKVLKQIEWRTRTLREKVRIYVPLHVPAGVIGANDLVPRDTVLLLDAAVRGDTPEPVSVTTGESFEIASDIRFNQLVDSYVGNLGVGHQIRSQLTEAQAWAKAQYERDRP